MNKESYDAIVVGARCAGSPTAMLLARKGYRVLLLDKATFPSDTMSTHLVHPPGVAALERWGLLERLEATGCPPVETYSFDFGPLTIAGSPQPIDGIAHGYCPRRTVLDKLLVDAAVEAGAELREGFTVDEILADDGTVTGIRGHEKGGAHVTERARVVIGADGKHSLVAKAVKPEQYDERPSHLAMYYAYWSGLPVEGFDTTIRAEDRRGWAADPDPRRSHRAPVRLAGRGVSREPQGHRGQLLRDDGPRPRVRRARARGEAGVEVHRLSRAARVLPQAVRPRLGAARRRRLPQESDHRDGHQRRVPRRRAGGRARSTMPSRGGGPTRRG